MSNPNPYSIHTLSNGLRVLYLPNHRLSSVYISFTGKAGHRSETEAESGVAHFLEHLMLDGTTKCPNAYQLNQFLENFGAYHNAMTGPEFVKYYAKIIHQYSEKAFAYISDIIFNSLLTEIDKEKKVIQEETLRSLDDPGTVLYFQTIKSVFPDNSINHTLLASQPYLENINQTLINNFIKKYYNTSNFILVVAGNITLAKTLKLAEKYFSQTPSGKSIVYPQAKRSPDQTTNIFHRQFNQSKLSISFPGCADNSPDVYTYFLLARILGAGQSSRLFNKLRHQEHLVYSVGASSQTYSDTGIFNIIASLKEENVQQAANLIFTEVKKLLIQKINVSEFDKAKTQARSSELFFSEDTYDLANDYDYKLLYFDKIDTIDQNIKLIDQISLSQVQNLAEKIFASKPKVNLITSNLKKLEIIY